MRSLLKAATNDQLASGFQEHLEQTKGHAERLEKILSSLDESTRGPKCKGMEGAIAEGSEMIGEGGRRGAGCGSDCCCPAR
jgi:ferritin-like metal-binding protein YciE